MKIKVIRINNFRSIKEATLFGPSDDIWTFVGQNNAGKSSVMHAIRAFYGEYDVKLEDFCRADGANKPIEITIEYQCKIGLIFAVDEDADWETFLGFINHLRKEQ